MKTVMFWSCTGVDASELSFSTAELLAETEKTLIAELPCLGIPRLGFVCGVMDRGRNIEAAIAQYERQNAPGWDMVHAVGKRLYALPASVFATPDYPVSAIVSVSVLMGFVPALLRLAGNSDCGCVVLECQGQLNSPLAFFSLKEADQVVIPLGKPTEAAYALASVKRLVQVYRYRPQKFILAASGNSRAIEKAVLAQDGEHALLEGMQVTSWDRRKIKAALERGEPGYDLHRNADNGDEEESSVMPATGIPAPQAVGDGQAGTMMYAGDGKLTSGGKDAVLRVPGFRHRRFAGFSTETTGGVSVPL